MKYIYIILFILFIAGCSEEKDCLDYSGNSGLIIEEIAMGECYSYLVDGNYLIKDTVAYKRLPSFTDDSIQVELGCAGNPSRPDLDFDEIMLLGTRTSVEGCIVSYMRNVTYDSTEHVLYYTIDVHSCGDCGLLRHNMNWVSVPSIEEADSLNVSIKYY